MIANTLRRNQISSGIELKIKGKRCNVYSQCSFINKVILPKIPSHNRRKCFGSRAKFLGKWCLLHASVLRNCLQTIIKKYLTYIQQVSFRVCVDNKLVAICSCIGTFEEIKTKIISLQESKKLKKNLKNEIISYFDREWTNYLKYFHKINFRKFYLYAKYACIKKKKS